MKFTQSHEWINASGITGTVGITHYAQKELGDIVYIELPEVGKKISAGQEVAVLESTKAAADVYSPVSGTIITINETLKTHPEYVNQDAEGEGWLYKIELTNQEELSSLMDEAAYRAMIE